MDVDCNSEQSDTSCNTDLTMSDINELELLKVKCDKLQNEVNFLNLSDSTFLELANCKKNKRAPTREQHSPNPAIQVQ